MTEPDSIRPAVAAIEARIQLLQKELAELHVAMRVLKELNLVHGRVSAPVSAAPTAWNAMIGSRHANAGGGEAAEVTKDVDQSRNWRTFIGRVHDNVNNRTLFSHILKESASPWLTANEIQEAASKLKGVEIPMSTVSPTLSDMKKQGIVIRDGMRVILRDRALAMGDGDPAFGRWLINLEHASTNGEGEAE